MNSSRFFIFYISIWCSYHVAKVQSNNEEALVYNVENNTLMEINRADKTSKCNHCLTACPALPDSEEEEINKQASNDKNAIFVQNVYKDMKEGQNIEADICKKPPIPAIVYEPTQPFFEIGYEMFYDETMVKLPYSFEDIFKKVVKGEPSEKSKKPPKEDFIETEYDDEFELKLKLVNGSKRIFRYHWVSVLSVDVSENVHRRMISFRKDTINDFYHKVSKISHCKEYFFGGATETDDSLEANEDDSSTKEQVDEKTQAQTSKQPIKMDLEKTQILPMQMFHTSSARIATCMFMNITFIKKDIANGILKTVDMFLYSMYRLWPDEITIKYAVQGQSSISTDAISSEGELFTKYPIPKIAYRIVQWKHGNYDYQAAIVIHNDTDYVRAEDRICTIPVDSWDIVKGAGVADSTIGTVYTCSLSLDNMTKLGIYLNKPLDLLDLKDFPQLDNDKKIITYGDVTKIIRDEFNRRIKETRKNKFWGFPGKLFGSKT